jgi:SAM-dependent methyltransferase
MTIAEAQKSDCPPTEIVAQCPLCRSTEAEFMFSASDRLHLLPGDFALVRCSSCGLVRLSPRPLIKQLGFYYLEDEYYSYRKPVSLLPSSTMDWRGKSKAAIRNSVMAWKGYPTHNLTWWQRALQPLFVALFRERIPYGFGESFPRYTPGGRALEIGCGSGAFLGLLKHHGWQVAGLDISETAAATAKRELGIDVFVGDLRDAPFTADSFDYIHMRHVFEHFPEPLAALQAVTRWLKPGGMMYIETPNLDSFPCQKQGRYWFHWEAPRHLCLFTPAMLAQTATAAGLAIKKLSTTVGDDYNWAEMYRREEREQRPIANRPLLPNRPDLGIGSSIRYKAFGIAARLAHLYKPLNGDNLCCWATKPGPFKAR